MRLTKKDYIAVRVPCAVCKEPVELPGFNSLRLWLRNRAAGASATYACHSCGAPVPEEVLLGAAEAAAAIANVGEGVEFLVDRVEAAPVPDPDPWLVAAE